MSGLINCSTCGNQISASAKSCPHCGEPVKKIGCISVTLIFIIAPLIGLILFVDMANESTQIPKPTKDEYLNTAVYMDYRSAMLEKISKDTLLSFSGEINQIVGDDRAIISTKALGYSYLGESVFLLFDAKPQFLEEDVVHIYGRYQGTRAYEAVLGNERTVPVVKVDYYSLEAVN